jgi:hypothetical protein
LLLQDAAAYAKTIVDVDDSVFLSQLKSKLVINMPNEFSGHIDVIPLIQLRLLAPHVKIELGHEAVYPEGTRPCPPGRTLSVLFGDMMEDFSEAEKEEDGLQHWLLELRAKWVLKGFSAVHFKTGSCYYPNKPCVHVKVNAAHELHWMNDGKYARECDSENFYVFCIRLGWSRIQIDTILGA